MVMAVVRARVETGGVPGQQDASRKAVLTEKMQRVVDRLGRDRAQLAAHMPLDRLDRAVRTGMDGAQHSQTLGRDLHPPCSQVVGGRKQHLWTVPRSGINLRLESVYKKYPRPRR